jgi:hypothetical protein
MAGYLIIYNEELHTLVPISRVTTKVNIPGLPEYGVQLIKQNKVLVLSTTERTDDYSLCAAEAKKSADTEASARINDVNQLENEVWYKMEQLKKVHNSKERADLLREIDEWTLLIQQHMRSLDMKYNVNGFKVMVAVTSTQTINRLYLHQCTKYKLNSLELVWVPCTGNPERLLSTPTIINGQSVVEVDVLEPWHKMRVREFFNDV